MIEDESSPHHNSKTFQTARSFRAQRSFRSNNYNSPLEVKTASASEYQAAIAYSAQNPPQVSPPDFDGEVRMVTNPNASSGIQNSIHFNEIRNTLEFNQSGEDRCIQSNVRIVGYYEVTITDIGNEVVLALGYATKPYPPFRFPGWEKHSVAYHSDNGNKFFNDPGDGMQYGPRYGAGDIIGCGYTNSSDGNQVFFFTRNGKHLGIAFTTAYLKGETFAIIGADGPCSMSLNFGKDVIKKPFSCQAINFGTIEQPEEKDQILAPPVIHMAPQSNPPPTYSSTQNQNAIPPPIEGQPSNQYPAPSSQYPAPDLLSTTDGFTVPPPNV